MAKRIKAGELDESMIIRSFKDTELLSNPADVVAGKPDNGDPAQETGNSIEAKEEQSEEAGTPVHDSASKRKSRRKGNYDEVFLKRKELKTRQPVYISRAIHQRIIKLVHVLALADNDISVGGYIDNVLEEHLERHKEEIAEMYRRQLDDIMNP